MNASTLQFLKDLAKNNNRDWFNENKNRYTEAQQEVIKLTEQLLENMASYEPEMAKIDAKKTLFRIYRDTRFSADKSPYKTNFGASINGIGKKDGRAGYYLHIEPGKSFLAAGVYMPTSQNLKVIRKEISENFDEFSEIITHKDFKNYEWMQEKLSRIPQGFEKDDPAAEFLKMKHFIVSKDLTDKELLQENAAQIFADDFKIMKPFVDFLNASLL